RRPWKGEPNGPSTTATTSTLLHNLPIGVAARVIEMEVGVDHPADVGGGVAELRERIFEPGAPVFPLVRDPVDVLELGVFLVAEPGVHEDQPVIVLDQQTTERQGNAVALIGRNAALPQRFRHDAEHGVAVEGFAAGYPRANGKT